MRGRSRNQLGGLKDEGEAEKAIGPFQDEAVKGEGRDRGVTGESPRGAFF